MKVFTEEKHLKMSPGVPGECKDISFHVPHCLIRPRASICIEFFLVAQGSQNSIARKLNFKLSFR